MWNFFKKKVELPKEFDPKLSKVWRELYAPPLVRLLDVANIDVDSIKEMHSLLFFLATEENLNDCLKYIAQKNYKKLSEMNNRVPYDFDEKDYPMYDVVYIIGSTKNHFALVYDNGEGTKKDITLKHIIEVAPIDLLKFLGRRLIYPI